MNGQERRKSYFPMFIGTLMIWFMNVYWYSYPFLKETKTTIPFINQYFSYFQQAGLFTSSYKLRLWCVLAAVLICIVKAGKNTKTPWRAIIIIIAVGLAIYMLPFTTAANYLLQCTAGFTLLLVGLSLAGRKFQNMKSDYNNIYETFQQCDEKKETDYSVNIPTTYQYQHKKHKGWINIVSPFRSVLIFGTPGSGKSFSVVHPIIEQTIARGFSMICYDYKMPDLSKIVYNKYLQNKDIFKTKYGVEPKFCILNFNEPRQSMRCNPLEAKYLTDKADAFEVADVLMHNVKSGSKNGEDFWVQSAKAFIAAYVWFLKKYKNGIYCTFPHLIELMGINYQAVLEILQQDTETKTIVQSFVDAMKTGAQEMLQSQISSARIPMLEFDSAALYWVLTGNDFSLDVNNVREPKIICIGNDPKRQSVYGAALALYMSRIMRIINAPTNLYGEPNIPCAVIFDEFPTVYMKGIDNLIDTARSNKVFVCLAAQDMSQIVRDYGREEADVIINSPGTIISGQVNGTSAKTMSETFGQEYRLQESQTTGGEHDTISMSFHQTNILPQSKIETLTNGYFFGKVADDNDCVIERKLFCGKIKIDLKARKADMKSWKKIKNFSEDKFNDAKIKETIEANAEEEIIFHLIEEAKNEEMKKKAYNENYIALSVATLSARARKKYDEMSKKEREALLNEIIKKAQDEDIRRIMNRNSERIKEQVRAIFDDFDINLENYGVKDNGQNPKTIDSQPNTGTTNDEEQEDEF